MSPSRTRISRTPFQPADARTRAGAPKRDARGRRREHELRRLLGLSGFPGSEAVEPVSFIELARHKTSWSSFCRARISGEDRRAGNTGYGFRIEFPEPVRGPVAVGYGAHFGMGGFEMKIDYTLGHDHAN